MNFQAGIKVGGIKTSFKAYQIIPAYSYSYQKGKMSRNFKRRLFLKREKNWAGQKMSEIKTN
ncbi:MAG: hypothetical protein Q8M54_10680 [Desulfobaccales bacterium]|nr:hypothetical protein [Desulfobaccales bacterium]